MDILFYEKYLSCVNGVRAYIVCVHNIEYVYFICGYLPYTTHISIVYVYIVYMCIMLNMCTCKRVSSTCIFNLWISSICYIYAYCICIYCSICVHARVSSMHFSFVDLFHVLHI